ILFERLASKDKPVDHQQFADRLVEYTQRLDPGAAAALLTQAMEKETDANGLGPAFVRSSLAEGLAAVAGRMEPGETARILTLALEKEKGADARYQLALG